MATATLWLSVLDCGCAGANAGASSTAQTAHNCSAVFMVGLTVSLDPGRGGESLCSCLSSLRGYWSLQKECPFAAPTGLVNKCWPAYPALKRGAKSPRRPPTARLPDIAYAGSKFLEAITQIILHCERPPSGAKARPISGTLSARLKSCPDTRLRSVSAFHCLRSRSLSMPGLCSRPALGLDCRLWF